MDAKEQKEVEKPLIRLDEDLNEIDSGMESPDEVLYRNFPISPK